MLDGGVQVTDQQQLCESHDAGQRVVQFVGDTGHQLPDGGHLLRLEQPLGLAAVQIEPVHEGPHLSQIGKRAGCQQTQLSLVRKQHREIGQDEGNARQARTSSHLDFLAPKIAT